MRLSKTALALAIAGLTGTATAAPASSANEISTLKVWLSAKHGPYLVDGDGRAVYLFTADTQGQGEQKASSTCFEACATAWPPVTARNTLTAAGEVRKDLIGFIRHPSRDKPEPARDDGTGEQGPQMQVTYNGWPLYQWQADAGKNSATGQGLSSFGGKWHLVSPAGMKATAVAAGTETPTEPARIGELFGQVDFQGPECIRHDTERDRYLVSNINGEMRAADNNGFISLLDPSGNVAKRKWISADQPDVTLNAPKGMQIAGNELHVADIDHLRTFDLETGKPLRSLYIDGALFLNDIAAGPDGALYITDTGTKDAPGAVYRISPEKEVTRIASGRDLHRPNGIAMTGNGNLVIVTFGADSVLTMTTEGEITNRQAVGAGQLDGLVLGPESDRLVSSWKGKHIVRVVPDGGTEMVLTDVTTPAAFDVDRKRGLLLVPLVRENTVAVAPF